MKLRTRIFTTILTVVGLMTFAVFWISAWWTLNSADAADREQILGNARHTRMMVLRELDHLRRTSVDWSNWNDTWRYARGELPAFVADNLSPDAFVNNGFEFVVIRDAQGAVRYARQLDHDAGTLVPLAADRLALAGPRPAASAGLVAVAAAYPYPVMIADFPILDSAGRGPSAGRLVLARRLDTLWVADDGSRELRAITQSMFVPPDGPQEAPANHFVHYVALPSASDAPAVWLALREPRRMRALATESLGVTALALPAVGLAIAGLLMLLVQRQLLGRLGELHQALFRLSIDPASAPRELAHGNDEIGDISQTIMDLGRSLQRSMGDVQRSAREWERSFAAVPDAIFVTDATGTVLLLNPAACEHFHLVAHEAIGQPLRRLLTCQCKDSPDWPPDRATGPSEWTLHCCHRARYFKLNWQPMSDGDGEGALCVARDITPRVLAEQALRDSENRLRLLLDSTGEGIYAAAPDGTCTLINPAAARLLGYDGPERLLGQRIHALIHHTRPDGTPYPPAECRVYGVYTTQQPVSVEDELFWRADGTSFPVEYTAHPIRDGAHIIGTVCCFRDVSARRAAEQERARLEAGLQQSQKMEVLGQLTGGIAHDFNNILAAILGNAQLAQMALARGNTDPLGRYVEGVIASAQRARDLIAQMLTFSRAPAASEGLTDIAPVIDEVTQMLRATLPATLVLDIVTHASLPPVRASAVQLHQVLMNLAVNARDAMGGTGTLRIEAGLVRAPGPWRCASCPAEIAGPWVALVVTDSGAGIPAERLARIFDPFYTTKEIGQGTGLGLAVVHGIVHAAGGHIRVESAPGRTCFTILLPAAADAVASAHGTAPTDAVNAPRRGARVMVVDDEPALVSVVTDVLENLGCRPSGYLRAADALDEFERAPGAWDLLITDQTMPGLTGLELVHALRRLRPELPVILTTGYSQGLTEDSLQAAGIRTCLRKPVVIDEWAEAIGRELGQTAPAPA